MEVSDRFIEWLASWEGEELEAYKVAGEKFWTIGVGHTGKVRGKTIHKGMRITKKTSRRLLREDLNYFEDAVTRRVPYLWRRSRRRFETCVSLAFNMGEEILTVDPPLTSFAECLRHKVTKTNIARTAKTIKLYDKGGSPLQVMPGLVHRRKAEAHLFNTGEYRNN